MSGVSTRRLFSMPAFEGLRQLRVCLQENPSNEIQAAIDIVSAVEADAATFDLEASIELHELVSADCFLDGHSFYRECIAAVVITKQPIWAKQMLNGRKRFVSKLNDEDDKSMFEAGGLLLDPPTTEIIDWWDSISGKVRLAKDSIKNAQARLAESLSMQYEQNRLLEIGIELQPEWTGFEDNFAGYDVLSYDEGEYSPRNKLIEVKSTTASPLRFFVTRNEWETALKYSDSYFFHVWDMDKDPAILYEKTADDILPHIPSDNEKGKWALAQIPLGAT